MSTSTEVANQFIDFSTSKTRLMVDMRRWKNTIPIQALKPPTFTIAASSQSDAP